MGEKRDGDHLGDMQICPHVEMKKPRIISAPQDLSMVDLKIFVLLLIFCC